MDIQAALRDGYSQEEIAKELGKRTGMDTISALNDGYSLDEIQAEANKRTGSKKYTPEQAKAMQREFILKEGTFDTKTDQLGYVATLGDMAKKATKATVPYIRPAVEASGATLGAMVGAGSGFLGGAGLGAIPGAVVGGSLGYASSKNIMDTLEGKWAQSPTEIATRAIGDVATGATFEMGGQALAPVVGAIARNTPKAILHPIDTATEAWNNMAKKSAQARIEASMTKEGEVAAMAARNADEFAKLQEAIPELRATPAAITNDPARLKMQQELQFNAEGAAAMREAEVIKNRGAINNYFESSLPKGNVDDVLAAIQQRGAQTSDNVISQATLLGKDKELASATMRDLELKARAALKAQADGYYSQVPKDMTMDSTPLYRKLQDLGDSVDPAFADPRNMPRGMMNRAMGGLEVETAGSTQQFDYKGIYNQLTQNQGFTRGKTGKGYFTDSDFTRTLNQFYPSLKGYPKNEVLGALQDAIDGVKAKPFRQGILDDMAYDLKGAGATDVRTAADTAFDSFMPPDLKELSYGQIMQYNEQVTKALRDARSRPGQENLARTLGEIKDGVQQTLKLSADTGDSAGVAALNKANQFYRETYVPTVRQGSTAKNLATDRTGAFRVDDEISAGKYLQTGDAGLASGNDFLRTFKNTPEAKQALTDYAKRDLLDAATANGTQAPSLKAAEKWIADRMPALGKIGLQDEFKGFQSALQRQSEIEAFTNVIGKDPQQVLPALLNAKGADSRVKAALDLKTLVKGNKAAEDGLKRSFADMMMNDTGIVKQVGGVPVISDAKMKTFWSNYEPAMKLIYTKEEMQALQNVRKAFEIENRFGRSISGVDGSQTKGMANQVSDNTDKLVPFSNTGRIIRAISRIATGSKAKLSQDFILKAQFDPSFAKELQNMASKAKTQKEANRAANELLGRFSANVLREAND